MKTNKLANLVLINLFVLLISCDDYVTKSDIAYSDSNAEMNIHFSVSDISKPYDSRSVSEGSDVNNSIKDVWLIEYDQIGAKKSEPQYFSADELTTVTAAITMPEGVTRYKLAAIANTHNPDLYDALDACGTISALSELKYNFIYPESDLIMNGVAEISSGQSEISMMLYRNVAKLNVNITNLDNSGVTLKAIRVESVPVSCRYLDSQSGSAESKCVNFERQFLNDSDFIASEYGESLYPAHKTTLSYYLPRNMKGTADCTKEYSKNACAPDCATKVHIYGVASDGFPVEYTFYPGKNMINNFDIEPNHAYSLDIVISDKGNARLDSRVEHLDHKYLSDANSHIISWNPVYGACQRLYSFEIDRINRFWKYIATTDQNKYSLSDGDEWVAEVVWQDSPEDLFYFCDDNRTKKEPCCHTVEGTWPENSIRLRPTGVGTGNVVVGVRKKNHDPEVDGYMWSWHLWITDYDPDYKGGVNDSQSYYAVEGGGVHRYLTGTWKTNLPASNGCIIMDRNYGAKRVDASNQQEQIECSGMYYHFGRKDPFPDPEIPLYCWKKTAETERNETEIMVNDAELDAKSKFVKIIYASTTIENSVNHPNWIYNNSSYWLTEHKTFAWTTYHWNAPAAGDDIFDPCPFGWQLPNYNHYVNASYTLKEFGARYASYNLFFPFTRGFYASSQGFTWQKGSDIARILSNRCYNSANLYCWSITSSAGNVFNAFYLLLPTRLIRKPR